MVALTGGLLGVAVALPVFGYPPAYLAPADDDREDCGRRRDATASATVQLLREAGVEAQLAGDETPSRWSWLLRPVRLQAARCGTGIEVWGAPLRPSAQQRWLSDAERLLTSDAHHLVLEAEAQRRQALDAEQRALTADLDAATVLLAAVASAVDPAVLLTPEESAGATAVSLRSELTALARRISADGTRLAEVERELSTERGVDDLLGPFASDTVLLEPPSPLLPITLAAVLGVLIASLTYRVVGQARATAPERERASAPANGGAG